MFKVIKIYVLYGDINMLSGQNLGMKMLCVNIYVPINTLLFSFKIESRLQGHRLRMAMLHLNYLLLSILLFCLKEQENSSKVSMQVKQKLFLNDLEASYLSFSY